MERQSGYPERRLGGIVGKESTGTCISYSPRTGRLCPRHTLIDCTVVVLPLALRYADSRARECYRIPARHLGEHHPSTSFPPSPQGLRLFARCADCAIARLVLDVSHAPREGAHVAGNLCPLPSPLGGRCPAWRTPKARCGHIPPLRLYDVYPLYLAAVSSKKLRRGPDEETAGSTPFP